MSKMPIAWHRECLKNAISSYELECLAVHALLKRVVELEDTIATYEVQILTAIKQGRHAFDRDRFMVKKD